MASGPTGAVLFGGGPTGIDGGGGPDVSTDTWVWNGGVWTQVCAPGTCGPDGRMFPGMAGNGEQVVMFGGPAGRGSSTTRGSSTVRRGSRPAGAGCRLCVVRWVWPGRRSGGRHAIRDVRRLADGCERLHPPVDDTWTFDGAKWEHVCGASSGPRAAPPRERLRASRDEQQPDRSLQGAVMGGGGDLFTGGTQVLQRDPWIWPVARGRNWPRRGPRPPSRSPTVTSPPAVLDHRSPCSGAPDPVPSPRRWSEPRENGAEFHSSRRPSPVAGICLRPVRRALAQHLPSSPCRGARERLSANRGSGKCGRSQRRCRADRSGQRSPGHHRRGSQRSWVRWRSGGPGHTRSGRTMRVIAEQRHRGGRALREHHL